MHRPNRLKDALRDDRTVFGLLCSTPNPLVIETIGRVGFDFVIIVTERALANSKTLENMVRPADVVGLTDLVPVSDTSSSGIPRVPDEFQFWWQHGVRAFVLGDERGFAFHALQAYLRQFTKDMQQD